jgi:hypothetical protein
MPGGLVRQSHNQESDVMVHIDIFVLI